jgi:hypothetical protein
LVALPLAQNDHDVQYLSVAAVDENTFLEKLVVVLE